MLQGEDIFTVNTGMEAVYRFNATDDDDFTVSTMDGVPANGNLVQVGSELSFTFTVPFAMQNLADFSLGFSAEDSEGATSSLQPQLQICPCVNGNCTIDGVADAGADTIVLNCECPEGTVHWFATLCDMIKLHTFWLVCASAEWKTAMTIGIEVIPQVIVPFIIQR